MNRSDKYTFNLFLFLVFIIIAASLVIFILTPSPISPTKRLFGYITNVYSPDKTVYLDFDQAQWITDSKNGYEIKNPDPQTVKYPVASFTKVGTMIVNPGWTGGNSKLPPYQTMTLAQFEDIYRNPKSPYKWVSDAPFDITVIGGWVYVISQHYIP